MHLQLKCEKQRAFRHPLLLMTAVEQALDVFGFNTYVVLLKGEKVYHQTFSVGRRRIVMMAILTSVVIDGLLLMNDVVETDKVGSFFFLCMALIVNADLQNKQEKAELEKVE
ncbi:MAG: hypothetical protein R2825_30465 [Saprospiraceae bacterium]